MNRREATSAETAAIVEDMAFRAKTGEEVRTALAMHFTPEKLAALVGELPPEAQERIRKEFASRPVIRRFKFTDRRKEP